MAELDGGAAKFEIAEVSFTIYTREMLERLLSRAVYNEDSGLWYRQGENQIVNDGVEAGSYAEAFEKLYGGKNA